MRARCLAPLLLCLTAFDGVAGGLAVDAGIGAAYGVPVGPGGLGEPWIACQPPAACLDAIELRIELKRFRRAQELRAGATANADAPPGAAAIGPYGSRRYVPPPTPEANIQPAYRGASRLRPEYDEPVRAGTDTH